MTIICTFGMLLLLDLKKLLGKVFLARYSKFLGGIYSMKLVFTEEYPTKPPKEVRFTTGIFNNY
jgi:ubiquitin-protein ligase